MLSSLDPSTGRFKAHVVKDFLITSACSSAHESKIHCKIALLGGVFKLPEAVSSCMPTVLSQWSYFSVQEGLNGLFQLTSGAWMYFVHPPGTITRSIFFDVFSNGIFNVAFVRIPG